LTVKGLDWRKTIVIVIESNFVKSDERRSTSPTSEVTGGGRKARQNNLRLSAGGDQ